jgi:hypothetical protein
MFLKGLPIIVGISLLCGVVTAVIFRETKYFEMINPPTEISIEKYKLWKNGDSGLGLPCPSCPAQVVEKKVYNYELGALTAVSVFAGLLILNGLRKGKKPTSEN